MQKEQILRFSSAAAILLASILLCNVKASDQSAKLTLNLVDVKGKPVLDDAAFTLYVVNRGRLERRHIGRPPKASQVVQIPSGVRVIGLVVITNTHDPVAIIPPRSSKGPVPLMLHQSGSMSSATQMLERLKSFEIMKAILLAASKKDRQRILKEWTRNKKSVIDRLRAVRIPATSNKSLHRLMTDKKGGLYKDLMILRAGGNPRSKK